MPDASAHHAFECLKWQLWKTRKARNFLFVVTLSEYGAAKAGFVNAHGLTDRQWVKPSEAVVDQGL